MYKNRKGMAICSFCLIICVVSFCSQKEDAEKKRLSINYDGNGNTGGSAPLDQNDYEENDSLTVLGPGSLEKTGYQFDSWNEEQDGSENSYDEGDFLQVGSEDIVLYADWALDPDEDFTVMILPDTQSYVAWKDEILVSQIDWIVANKDPYNLKFVAHVGDLVQNYDTDPAQWLLIQAQLDRLKTAGIHYSTLPGNHDYQQNTRNSTTYNNYFPLSYFSPFTTFAGSFDSNSDNTYHIVDTGNEELLIMSLEFGPRDAVVDWANSILGMLPDTRSIIVTHAYLNPDGETLVSGDNHAASNGYGLGADVNDGIDLWLNLVYPNDNVLFVVCGHDGSTDDGAGLKTSSHPDGSSVYQILTNYQYFPWSDSGYLLILSFSPKNGSVDMKTYSPYLGIYKTAPDTQAEFSIK